MRTYGLRRRLAGAVGLLIAIVALSGASALLCAEHCSAQLVIVRNLAGSARHAHEIDRLARELHISISHAALGAPAATPAYWTTRLDAELAALRPELDPAQRASIDAVAGNSRELADIASRPPDSEAQVRALTLMQAIDTDTSALETSFEHRALDADRDAHHAVAMMLPTSVVTAIVALVFAVLAAGLLWRAFYDPMTKLTGVARRIVAGDTAARMPQLDARELAPVADAFNGMLDAMEAQRRKRAAGERLAAIGQIAAGVAHEINNPVAVSRGYLKTMRKEALSTQLRMELAILDEEAAACQRIAEDLLAYAREPQLVLAAVPIDALVKECVDRLPRGRSAPHVRVDVEPATLNVDSVRMKQVLGNLVRNAVQASPGDAAEIEIEGRKLQKGAYRLIVKDRGRGLPPGAGARVFEPFFSTRRDGSGLGLAVCFGLVTAHGGNIAAGERPGGGVEVRVELPGHSGQSS